MYLLDTNVVSELRKAGTNKIDHNVQLWASQLTVPDLYLSVITLLELEMGILLLERKDSEQGAILRSWFDEYVIPAFSGRILDIDSTIALHCAALHVPDHQSDRDALIAATALVHGMTVVTRNIADFEPTGVALLNPWLEQKK
ncbi:MAG: type II toxin-antitoxin system VapC family toxin [Candidatus Electrothrix aestuarii]|uniref:Type II toxin-antitoxin system VapC family toxin n=1 Tax=Candidatus Electrothrix aestuarii TaxID=3062594 RepID=A0AAU8LSI9_9BACT|nr:type II toxin-antitoxin system VapC family toxin [Candidatus Electrothrix aestuarii]WPD21038.1 MAG: type II toxin-antitoxin system VapC family toxin [Candidatus Electrothrix sp. GW3-3]